MRFFILLKCACLYWMIQAIVCAEAIQLAYSDLVPDKFAGILVSGPLVIGQEIRSTQTGSLPMIEEFIAGRYDICLLAMPEGGELPILNDSEITQLPWLTNPQWLLSTRTIQFLSLPFLNSCSLWHG